jgi:hypothetical protein
LLDTLEKLSEVDARRVLVFAPADTSEAFASMAANRFKIESQTDGDLGRRLSTFFRAELDAGAKSVVVVGTDSPTMPVEFVEQAFVALASSDVVIGPATDGGYYLLGCGRRLPPVFDDIDWGSSRVLAQTVARLSDGGWRVTLLPPWYDVDTPDDWAMLTGHIEALRVCGQKSGAPRTEALVGEFGLALSSTIDLSQTEQGVPRSIRD